MTLSKYEKLINFLSWDYGPLWKNCVDAKEKAGHICISAALAMFHLIEHKMNKNSYLPNDCLVFILLTLVYTISLSMYALWQNNKSK
jgi:hypothetical protein